MSGTIRTVRNLCPDGLSDGGYGPGRVLALAGDGYSFSARGGWLESPPFYSTLRMRRGASGTRVTGSRTDTVNWYIEYTWTTRLPFLAKATTIFYTPVLGGYDFSIKSEDGGLSENVVNPEFYMVQQPLILDGVGNGFFDPRRQIPYFISDFYKGLVVTQTWVDGGASGSDSAFMSVSPENLNFAYSTYPDLPATPRYVYDRWTYLVRPNGFDLTTLTPAQWRNLRGIVFSVATPEVASGLVTFTDVVETVEWELG